MRWSDAGLAVVPLFRLRWFSSCCHRHLLRRFHRQTDLLGFTIKAKYLDFDLLAFADERVHFRYSMVRQFADVNQSLDAAASRTKQPKAAIFVTVPW